MVKRTTEERFWNKVNKTESCWLWTAALDTHGYGHFYVGGSIAVGAHRYAYELLVGPIPAGMTLDHLCHNADPDCRGGRACIHRRCVNPTHLGVATSRENTLRGSALSATNATKDVCMRGHPFDEQNTIHDKRGWRFCRICLRAAQREWQRKHRRSHPKRRA